MDFGYNLSGAGGICIKKFQVGATLTRAGIPVLAGTLANQTGVAAAAADAAVEALGVTIDFPAARVTAQQTGNADTERLVSVIINPHAAYRIRLSGGSASGTILAVMTNTVASTDGLTGITATAVAAGFDDGWIWGYTGSNAGRMRKCEARTATTAPFEIAFPYDIAVGDTFIGCAFGPGEKVGVQLTTELDETDSLTQLGAQNFRCIELIGLDKANDGLLNSHAYVAFCDHMFARSIA